MAVGLGRAAAAAGLSGVSMSALMSQLALLPEDSGWDAAALPSGTRDVNGQQLDLRSTNSWLLKLDQVGAQQIWAGARRGSGRPLHAYHKCETHQSKPGGHSGQRWDRIDLYNP